MHRTSNPFHLRPSKLLGSHFDGSKVPLWAVDGCRRWMFKKVAQTGRGNYGMDATRLTENILHSSVSMIPVSFNFGMSKKNHQNVSNLPFHWLNHVKSPISTVVMPPFMHLFAYQEIPTLPEALPLAGVEHGCGLWPQPQSCRFSGAADVRRSL